MAGQAKLGAGIGLITGPIRGVVATGAKITAYFIRALFTLPE